MEHSPITVPLIRRGNHLFVTAQIQQQPLFLCVDSGAGAHVLDRERALAKGITGESGTVRAVGAAGSVSATPFPLRQLTVGGAPLAETTGYILPLPYGLDCDGILGYPLFAEKVVTMDYQALTLTLTTPQSFTPPKGSVMLPLNIVRNIANITAVVDGRKAILELDTGSGGTVDLNTPYVQKHKLTQFYTKRFAVPTGKGIGGITYGERVRARRLQLGSFTLIGVPLDLASDTQGANAAKDVDGRIGSEILERFVVTFDYPRKRLYLKPQKNLSQPFVGMLSGLFPDVENGVCTIIAVLPGSPAAEAGIVAGDEVLQVNGTPLSKMSLYDLRSALNAPIGTRVRLLLKSSGGKGREVTMTLREML